MILGRLLITIVGFFLGALVIAVYEHIKYRRKAH